MRLPGGQRGLVGKLAVDDDVGGFTDRIDPGVGSDLEGERVRDIAEAVSISSGRLAVKKTMCLIIRPSPAIAPGR
jgi:hypothetical protein